MIHDPLGEHTATLLKKYGKFSTVKIHFDTHEGNTMMITGKGADDKDNELLLFDVQIENSNIEGYCWVINCACSPFRPLSMRFVPKDEAIENKSCFDIGIDEALDLKVGEITKNELIQYLKQIGVDNDIAGFVVDYGYFRSKKNDVFQLTNLIRFLGDEEVLDADAAAVSNE